MYCCFASTLTVFNDLNLMLLLCMLYLVLLHGRTPGFAKCDELILKINHSIKRAIPLIKFTIPYNMAAVNNNNTVAACSTTTTSTMLLYVVPK